MDDKIIDINTDIDDQNEISNEESIHEIEVRMQEIDVLLERYEDIYYSKGETIMSEEEVIALKQEYNKLRKTKKSVEKTKTKWDKMPIWMFMYGVFQIIFSFFYVLATISIEVGGWLIRVLGLKTSGFWKYSTLLFVPVLSLVTSLLILLFIKDRDKKRFFIIMYIIQGIETIITVVILLILTSKI